MLPTILLSFLAATATFVCAEQASGPAAALVERHGNLVDVNAVVDVAGLRKIVLPVHERMARKQKQREIAVELDVSVSVQQLLTTTLATVTPLVAKIETTVADVATLAKADVAAILEGAFETIEGVLSGLAGDLATLGGKHSKRSLDVKREISNQEVAQTLADLLNSVAGAVNSVEGITGDLPILGPLLGSVYSKINGDLSLILSSVGNLLVGVLSLVKDLLDGVLGAVAGLPIVNGLLGGLLAGLL